MGENICQLYIWQGINIQNIQRSKIKKAESKKPNDPLKTMGYGSEQIVFKKRKKWPRNTISPLLCLTSRDRLLVLTSDSKKRRRNLCQEHQGKHTDCTDWHANIYTCQGSGSNKMRKKASWKHGAFSVLSCAEWKLLQEGAEKNK